MTHKTKIFLIVMCAYFSMVSFFTYYSQNVYFNNLPVVETVMPRMGERLENGSLSYIVPTETIRLNTMTGAIYVLLLKEVSFSAKNDTEGCIRKNHPYMSQMMF